jgi:uncharacterized protein
MPVYKYKTFEEARQGLWCKEPDRAYFRELNSLFALADGLSPSKYPSGVFKYRTIEEANKERDEWDLSNARGSICKDLKRKRAEQERVESEVKMSKKADLIEYLRDKKAFLREKFGVTRIGVFGSFARGVQTHKSDIDLIVEIEKNKKSIHTFLQLKRSLERELSRKVDLGFEHSLKPTVRKNIKKEIIYV